MNVSQVIAGCAHESSGTSYFIMNLCRALARSGVDLTLHSFDARVSACDGFQSAVYPITANPLKSLGWNPAMLSGLKTAACDADIIHTNGVWLMTNVYPAWVKNGRVKIVHSPHGMLSEWALSRSRWKKRIFGLLWQNRALRKADMFHATSQKEYEEIRALGYRQPVAIIPLGVEIPDVKRDTCRKELLHRMAFFGRIHQVKAVDRLVQAWEIIISDGRFQSADVENWELVIAGPDNGARGELEQYISDHKIPRVRFAGEINGPAKYDFLASSDICVLPSHTENFGVTVTEALACGTPVVTSKGTPWSGVVENGCGKWVDNAPESLAAAIGELMALSDDERREMGEKGRQWIQRDFSWNGVGLKMKMAYEWLLNPGKVAKPKWVRMD